MNDPTHEQDPQAPPAPEPAATDAMGDVTFLAPSTAAEPLPARLQAEAIFQLRKLSELREQELKRHELVLAEMRDHVRRQSRTGRLLLLLAVGILALLAALALAVHHLRADQVRATSALAATSAEVGRVGGLVRDTAAQSGSRLETIGGGLASNERKLDAFQLGLNATISDSMQGLRQEREAVVGGVRMALEDQNRKLVEREIALREGEAELQRESQRVRQERQRIIQEAIDKLSTLSKEAPAGVPQTP